jgi:hypothetical protein
MSEVDNLAAAGNNLPVRKRKKVSDDPDESNVATKKEAKTDDVEDPAASDEDAAIPLKRGPMSKAREIRLEQNRKAARESRRRKKVMIEELQRSVIFFSRANSTLKQQNDELSRIFMQAQGQISAIESGQQPQMLTTQGEQQQMNTQGEQQVQAQAVAQQAVYESQGFPAAAARTAAQTMNAGASDAATPAPAADNAQAVHNMQTGATMQAMANFQAAASAAMATAMGMNPAAAAAPGSNPQQAYTDTLNALAMQQAAAAAAGQQFPFIPQMQFQGMQFPGMQFAQAPAAPAPAAAQPQQQQDQQQQSTEKQG